MSSSPPPPDRTTAKGRELVGMSGRQRLVAVVTGASRGLGAGMAETFGAEGLHLGLCARTRPPLPATAPRGVSAAVDVTDAAALDAFAGSVADRFGRIDLWVNNAGVIEPVGTMVGADPAALRENLEVNVLGVLHGSATFARHVRSRPGGGVLVNMVSGAATHPYRGWAAYGASKAAVVMATEVLAREEGDHGLAAFALAPGVVDTAMQARVRASRPEEFPEVDRFRRLHAEGRLRHPSQVARFILERLVDGPRGGHADLPVQVRVPDEWPLGREALGGTDRS